MPVGRHAALQGLKPNFDLIDVIGLAKAMPLLQGTRSWSFSAATEAHTFLTCRLASLKSCPYASCLRSHALTLRACRRSFSAAL